VVDRAVVERAVGAEVVPVRAVGGFPQVVGPVRADLLAGLLGGVAGAGEVAVEQGGGELLPDQRAGGTRTHPVLLAFRVVGGDTMPRAATSGW